MMRVFFICHGNICRSPMAEFVFRDMAAREGLEVEVASAATSAEEIGNPVYPPVRRLLLSHGLDPAGKRARQLTRADYERWDLIIGMDSANIRNPAQARCCRPLVHARLRRLLGRHRPRLPRAFGVLTRLGVVSLDARGYWL